MTGNPLPWIVLAAAVAAALAFKGYIKLPAKATSPGASVVSAVSGVHPLDQAGLSGYSSYQLGVAFATAVRREAETGLANEIARQAHATITSTFTAPFSPAAPAPADPNQAGVKPPA